MEEVVLKTFGNRVNANVLFEQAPVPEKLGDSQLPLPRFETMARSQTICSHSEQNN